MPTYVMLANWTDQGVRTIEDGPEARGRRAQVPGRHGGTVPVRLHDHGHS